MTSVLITMRGTGGVSLGGLCVGMAAGGRGNRREWRWREGRQKGGRGRGRVNEGGRGIGRSGEGRGVGRTPHQGPHARDQRHDLRFHRGGIRRAAEGGRGGGGAPPDCTESSRQRGSLRRWCEAVGSGCEGGRWGILSCGDG